MQSHAVKLLYRIPRAIRLIVTSEDDSVASLVGWLVSRDAQNLCGSGKTVKQVGRVARACSDPQIGFRASVFRGNRTAVAAIQDRAQGCSRGLRLERWWHARPACESMRRTHVSPQLNAAIASDAGCYPLR